MTVAIILALLLSVDQESCGVSRHVKVSAYRLSFQVPASWRPVRSQAAGEVLYSFVGPSPAPEFAIAVGNSTFESAAELQGFSVREGSWRISGRGASRSAQEFRVPSGHGLFGVAEVGTHNEQGYTGLAEEGRAFVASSGTPSRSVAISSEPGSVHACVLSIAKSVRFE